MKYAIALLYVVASQIAHADFDRLTDLEVEKDGRVWSLPPMNESGNHYPIKYIRIVDTNTTPTTEIQRFLRRLPVGKREQGHSERLAERSGPESRHQR